MDPLADPDDLATRLGVSFTAAEEARAEALLADASAVVRNYTRQQLTASTDTANLESTPEQWLYLPERPVTAVSAVSWGGAALAAGLWRLQNDALFRRDGWQGYFYGASQPWNQPDTVAVTYTHGYDTIPDDIVRVVCKLAQFSWINPDGYRSMSTGGISVTLASETLGTGALDDADRKVLDFYRRPRRSVQLSAGLL